MKLSLEERTIAFHLRASDQDGSTYSSALFDDELIPFLDTPEDVHTIKSMPNSNQIFHPKEDKYVDLCTRNPFLGGYKWPLIKGFLRITPQHNFSVRDSLLVASKDPMHSGDEMKVAPLEFSSYSLANEFQVYHVLADVMGIGDRVVEGMSAYLESFGKVVESEYQRHIVEGKNFEPDEQLKRTIASYEKTEMNEQLRKDIIGSYERGFQESMWGIVRRNFYDLHLAQKTIHLDFCKDPANNKWRLEREGVFLELHTLLMDLTPGDYHAINTLARVTPEDMKKYIEKYGFNDRLRN